MASSRPAICGHGRSGSASGGAASPAPARRSRCASPAKLLIPRQQSGPERSKAGHRYGLVNGGVMLFTVRDSIIPARSRLDYPPASLKTDKPASFR